MAATFVVEDGTGKTDANSYITEAAADQYFENYGNSATWTGATSAQKQEALRFGAQFLEIRYATCWLGRAANEDQALAWPRCNVYIDGYLFDDADIPDELQHANAEAALRYLTDGELLPDITNPGSVKRKRLKGGEAEVDTEYFGAGQSQIKWYRKVDLMVRELVVDAGRAVRA